MSGSQKPDEHRQEEHCVDHENTESSGEASVCMQVYAGSRDGAIRPVELASFA